MSTGAFGEGPRRAVPCQAHRDSPFPQRSARCGPHSRARRSGCARWGWRFEVDQSVSRRAAQSQSCEPLCVEEDARIDVVSRLAGEALCPVHLGVGHGALVPLERLVGEGRVWTTATPVVLPGYDHRRGRAASAALRGGGCCATPTRQSQLTKAVRREGKSVRMKDANPDS